MQRGVSEGSFVGTYANWKALLLLSMIVPIGLFTGFKLTGVIRSVTPVETVALNPVNWDFPRPTEDGYRVDHTLTANYSCNELSLNTSIILAIYTSPNIMYGDNIDSLGMWLSISSTEVNSNGFIQTVIVLVNQDPQLSGIDWPSNDQILENLSIQQFNYGGINGPYVTLNDPNRTRGASFSGGAMWYLLPPQNVTRELLITYEITYYNGTTFKEVVQPFQLTLDVGIHTLGADVGIAGPSEFTRIPNVTVAVDGVSYQTPFSLFVVSGNYSINFPEIIQINSTTYHFDGLTINNEYDIGTPNLTRDVNGDALFTAYYGASQNG